MQARLSVFKLIVLATLLALSGSALAGEAEAEPAAEEAAETAPATKCADCQAKMDAAMTAKKEAMEAGRKEMEAADARLADLVSAMGSASKKDKVASMEAVISELVAQRAAMHQKHGKMKAHHAGKAMAHHGGPTPGCEACSKLNEPAETPEAE